MPRGREPSTEAGAQPEVTSPKKLLDQLVKGPVIQGDLESMSRQLKKAVVERAMVTIPYCWLLSRRRFRDRDLRWGQRR